jgi:type I restriction enzyme, S subunit
MSNWDEFRLGDLLQFQRGFDITAKEQQPGAIPVISSSGITSYHNKAMVTGPGVVTGRKGSLGKVHFIEGPYWPHDTTLWIRDFKGNNPKFLYYLLLLLHLENYDVGASNPTLNRNHIHKIKLKCPPLSIQKKIAAILLTYDDLIENNNKRIALLEKTAEEIYREWFVRMRFPGWENEKILKGIPKDWEAKKLSNYFGYVKGKSYLGNEINEYGEGLPFVNLKSMHRGGGYRRDGIKYYIGAYRENQLVYPGDVVMALTDMTQNREVVGRAARIPSDFEKYVISLDMLKLVPRNISKSFLYAFLRYSSFGNFIKEFANGANVLHLSPDVIIRQDVIVPPEALRIKFDVIYEPIMKELDFLGARNQLLERSRDMLLPRLISGNLAVDKLDIYFPPSMKNEEVTAAV